MKLTPAIVEVEVTALASGGDGVSRDPGGRVVFVPLTAPGDRVRVKLVEAKPSFARGEVVEVVSPGAARVAPVCPEVARGCGGCQWQQVARAEQLRAKQLIVANALRKLDGLVVHPIADPCPPLGWRRRARFHVEAGRVGLYARSSHRVLPLAHCPQLEPALDAALAVVSQAHPPDGELSMLLAYDGRIVVGHDRMWPAAGQLIGRAGIVGAMTGPAVWGQWLVETEPGLANGPHDFAQASAAGNAALIALTRAALGAPAPVNAPAVVRGPAPGRARRESYVELTSRIQVAAARSGRSYTPLQAGAPSRPTPVPTRAHDSGYSVAWVGDSIVRVIAEGDPYQLVELYAGHGNFTRSFAADGWDLVASDVVEPHVMPFGVRFDVGATPEVLATLRGPVEAVVLDPPRTGAIDAIDGIVALAPNRIVYVSCDPATLARDANKLVAAGYRATDAWPIDLMPQTSHVEVVVRFVKA